MVHNVLLKLAPVHLKKNDSSIIITKDKKIFGTIKISKGSIDYLPKSRKEKAISLNWTQFDDLMKRWENGEIR
jgi:hypothetical protein